MPALQALRQSVGALANVPMLKPDRLRQRVHGRYPEAAALPDRPALDHLLDEAGVPLQWNPTADDGAGAYTRPGGAPGISGFTAGPSTLISRQPTRDGSAGPSDAALADAQAAEDRLRRTLQRGGLLTLTVDVRQAAAAEAELLRRFGPGAAGDDGAPAAATAAAPLQRLSIDALLLRHLRAQADAANVDWNRVLLADAAPRDSRDWTNLQRLVQRSLPPLRQALLHAVGPLLVVQAGLLARYGLIGLLVDLEAAAGTPGHTPAACLLLPSRQPGRAAIDGTAVPLVHAGQVLALPQAWIENRHRAQAGNGANP
jgi:hypothetical protein